MAAIAGHKKPSNMTQVKDGPGVFKVEGCTYLHLRIGNDTSVFLNFTSIGFKLLKL